jgi:hypothetical protein
LKIACPTFFQAQPVGGGAGQAAASMQRREIAMNHLSLDDCICAMEYIELRHREPLTDEERPGFMVLAAIVKKEAQYRLSKLGAPTKDVVSFFNQIYSVATGKKPFNKGRNFADEDLRHIKYFVYDVIGMNC